MLTQEEIAKIRGAAGVSTTPPSSNMPSVSLTERLGIKEEGTGLRSKLGTAKAALGGIASGVGGIGLTAIDYAGRKMVDALPTEEENPSFSAVLPSKETKAKMQSNLAQAPKLQEKLKTVTGGDEHPTAFGIGQLGGEIAALAAPVGAIGKGAKVAAETLGAGQKTAKLTQAATEGLAFTAGQSLSEGKNQSLEDYAINTGLNIAFPGAGMVAKSVGENMPARIINSLIKPVQKDFAYGKNPGRAVAELVPPANDMEGLIANIDTTLNDVGNRIGQAVSQSPNLAGIDLSYTLKPIDEALKVANKTPRTNQTLIARLESVKEDLVDNINNGIDPQSYKKLIGDLTKWTGNMSDDAAINKSLKQIYGATREQMDNVLSKEMTPEQFAQYKKDSEAYGDLLSAKNAAEHRDKLLERQDLISFGAKNAGFLTGLSTAIATGGAGIPAIIAGLAGAGIDKAMATPAFKTRLAKLLSKLAPKEVETFFDKIPTAKSLFDEEQIKDFVGGFDGVKLNTGSVNPGLIVRDLKGKFSGYADKFSPKEYDTMIDFIDYAHGAKNVSFEDSVRLEEAAQKFLSDQGVKIPSTRAKLREAVQKIIGEANFPVDNVKKKATDSLEQEAKKYKSAEEFVKAQGTPLFHGTQASFKTFKTGPGETGQGVYFYPEKRMAEDYSGNSGRIVEAYVKGKFASLEDFYKVKKEIKDNGSWTSEKTIEALKNKGYVGVHRSELSGKDTYSVFDPKDIKTKDELLEIYKKSKK